MFGIVALSCALKRVIRKNPPLEETIIEVVELLVTDPFALTLKSHKLKSDLEGLWACWVEYDCRIIYTFQPNPDEDEDMIVLIDIGTHDEVY
ncbi:type II toxin-antitoxin system RelE/ParE family toxin [Nostoc sp.]|uniref:type II toxin-antitoxin system RelE/ParE family toxin n=1 Tax=Nostoc sp. TaxID=1180 RepID=UPI002FF466CB